MKICAMHDSRGKKSTTLTLVTASWGVITAKFFFAGMSLPLLGDVPTMSGGEYAAGVGAVLAIWLGREWTEKRSPVIG